MNPLFPKLIPALLAVISLNAVGARRYVDLNSPNPAPPCTNWLTAATNIQDAIDVAVDKDLVLITNGVYANGGREVYAGLTNRVAITKPIAAQSVNGPHVTMIQGFQVPGVTNAEGAVRCVYAANGTMMNGYTLPNGTLSASVFCPLT
jgi:hypothetical protein